MNNIKISPSSLNVFIRDPAAWVMRTFYKEYGGSNIYAIRGILVEHCVNMMVETGGKTSFDDFTLSAILKTLSHGIEFGTKELKEYYKWGIKCYKLLPHDIIDTQTHVEGNICNVAMQGYLDFEYKKYFIDLKSVNEGKLPKIVTRGVRKGLLPTTKKENIRQQVIYTLLTGKRQVLLFVDPNEEKGQWIFYKITARDLKEHLPIIKESLNKIKRFLTFKKEDVILEIQPDEKKMNNKWSFDWDDRLRDRAKEIWDLK